MNKLNNINNKKPFILYVGSREKYKNFEFFLKGYSISEKLKNDFDLLLFGGENFQLMKKKNNEYKLEIKFFIKKEQMKNYINHINLQKFLYFHQFMKASVYLWLKQWQMIVQLFVQILIFLKK